MRAGIPVSSLTCGLGSPGPLRHSGWDPYVPSVMRVGIPMSTCGLGSLCPLRHAGWDPDVLSGIRVGIPMSSPTCGLRSLGPLRHAGWDPHVLSHMRDGIPMSSPTCGLGSLCAGVDFSVSLGSVQLPLKALTPRSLCNPAHLPLPLESASNNTYTHGRAGH
jgi:hypothetical protein